MHERRQHPRLDIRLDAEYLREGAADSRQVTLANLSAGGAALITDEPLEAGSRLVYLHFDLEADDPSLAGPVEAPCEIARCERREGVGRSDEYLVGVVFLGLQPRDLERIHRLVDGRLARTGEPIQQHRRIELERPIAIRYGRFDEFVEEMSKNLSLGGMFIRTRAPHPPGSAFEFQLQLGEDFTLVEGRAEVIWTRRRSEGADRPAGMGIRFLELDPASRNVLRRLIEQHDEPEDEAGAESADGEPEEAASA